ncbi:MAG: hypothetical protein HY840_00250 [Bacteroidetes bacterium]|nr:hypothetical protein [Bacteroidota bacterium]
MKKLYQLFSFFFIVSVYYSCKSNCGFVRTPDEYNKKRSEWLRCIDTLYGHTKNTEVYRAVKTQVTDSLNKWILLGLPYTQGFKNNLYYIDEIIFFNKKMNQCIVMTVILPSNKSTNIICPLIGGEKIGKNWHFYLAGEPILSCLKNDTMNNVSNEEIIKYTRNCLIDLYLKPCCCEPNQKEFDEFIIYDGVRERHKLFLHNKSW